jgi:hypothetical protein
VNVEGLRIPALDESRWKAVQPTQEPKDDAGAADTFSGRPYARRATFAFVASGTSFRIKRTDREGKYIHPTDEHDDWFLNPIRLKMWTKAHTSQP